MAIDIIFMGKYICGRYICLLLADVLPIVEKINHEFQIYYCIDTLANHGDTSNNLLTRQNEQYMIGWIYHTIIG
jgi:hypothetical protein